MALEKNFEIRDRYALNLLTRFAKFSQNKTFSKNWIHSQKVCKCQFCLTFIEVEFVAGPVFGQFHFRVSAAVSGFYFRFRSVSETTFIHDFLAGRQRHDASFDHDLKKSQISRWSNYCFPNVNGFSGNSENMLEKGWRNSGGKRFPCWCPLCSSILLECN